MGMTPTHLQIILNIAKPKASIITIGRQRLYESFVNIGGKKSSAAYFGDDGLSASNAWRVSHMDISDFEGAAVVHDLNAPLDREKHAAHLARYDLVIDSGTLEHIFNVPEALGTYDSLVRTGGFVYITTNANNHFGHGFYQFSSDLFFRFFSIENGYEMIDCFLESHPVISAEVSSRRRYYGVADPAALRRRTLLVSGEPTLIHVIARKVAARPLARSLIQSGYADRWARSAPADSSATTRELGRRLRAAFPGLWAPLVLYRQRWRYRLGRNRDFAIRSDPADGVRTALAGGASGSPAHSSGGSSPFSRSG